MEKAQRIRTADASNDKDVLYYIQVASVANCFSSTKYQSLNFGYPFFTVYIHMWQFQVIPFLISLIKLVILHVYFNVKP